jgi:hypothetical protein
MAKIAFHASVLVFFFIWTTEFSVAQSGSSYILPGITTSDTITIGNLNPQATTATIGFYDSSGKLSSLTVELAAGAQTRVNPTTVALTTFSGSVVVSGPLPLTVSADRFEGSTGFDFIYPSEPSADLIIPFLPSGASVDVNIFNPGTNTAEVKVVLMQSTGAHTDARTATVDPLHTTTINIPSSTNVEYVFVITANLLRPDSPVAANAVIRSFAVGTSGAVPRTDFAVVSAVPRDRFATTSSVPFFAQGPDYFSLLQVDNLSSSEQTVSITATRADGTPLPGTNNPASVVIPPYGSTRQEMAALFGSTATTFSTGTISVTSQGTKTAAGATSGAKAPLTATVAIGNISEPSFAVMLPTAAQSTFAFQLRGTGREFFTGISLQNAGATDAHITLAFVLDQGATISTISLVVPHSQQTIGTLADIFPEAQGNGFIWVQSDVPITAVGMDGRSDNSALALRLPVYASPSFAPAPQQSFSIVGTVRDPNTGVNGQNIGVPNVAFGLTGPIQATTASDGAGTFTFRDLSPGRYDLAPLPVGYTVSPGGSTIVITNANSRNNDFTVGLTTPSISTINPASALVNSSNAGAVQITVQGSNFTPPTTFTGNIFTGNINKFTTGSVVLFGASQVATTVVNPTVLTASIDPTLLVTTGPVQIRVRNLGPSGDFIDSSSLTFIVGTAPPTLSSVTGQPSPIVAGTVTNPFTVIVNGTGFTPATQMRVNFQARLTTYVNENQVIGTVLPSDVSQAGFVPITVQNPNSVDSTPFQLPVLYPIPAVTQISPTSLMAQVSLSAQPVQITVNGTSFGQNPTNLLDTAMVLVNGTAVVTQYVSSTQLIALVPATYVATPGLLQITVANPQPNLAPSNAAALFVVNPVPVITSVDAGNVVWNPNTPPNASFNQPVVIVGSNFSPNATVWVNPPCDALGFRKALSTVRNSSTQVIATIPIRCAGPYMLEVENPQPGGGLSAPVSLVVPSIAASANDSIANPQPNLAPSNAATLFVANPVPVITSIAADNVVRNPSTPPNASFNQPVVIVGSNFSPNAIVSVNPPCDALGFRKALSTVRNSSTQVIATIPIPCAGAYMIEVENPQPDGGLSAPVSLVVPSTASSTLE